MTSPFLLCYFASMGNKQRIKLEDELIAEARRKHGEGAARELSAYFVKGNRVAAIRRCRELGIAVQE